MTDATLLGAMGIAAAAVLVATAAGLFADPPPDTGTAAQPARIEQPSALRVLAPVPIAETPRTAGLSRTALEAITPAAPPAQEEWRVPQQPELKAARPPVDTEYLPRPAPVFAPGEQQAAWAARDKLANHGRAGRPAAPPVLTRLHEGPPPDKANVER